MTIPSEGYRGAIFETTEEMCAAVVLCHAYPSSNRSEEYFGY
jgi:hypothetical protein